MAWPDSRRSHRDANARTERASRTGATFGVFHEDWRGDAAERDGDTGEDESEA